MNLLTITQECGRLLSDPNNDRWSAATLTTRINLAQTEIEGYTGAVKTTSTYTPLAAGDSRVLISALAMNIAAVYATRTNGTVVPLKGITIDELDFQYPNWRQWSPGEPLMFYVEMSSSSPRINLIPAPDAANVIASGIIGYEIRQPADLVNPTDIPFDSIPNMIPYHYSIVHWVVAHCFMDDGTPEALGKSKFHRSGSMLKPGEYEKEIGRIMAEFNSDDGVPLRILWKPEGGRTGSWMFPSKSNPLPW